MVKSIIIGYSFVFAHNSDIRTQHVPCIHRFEDFRVLLSALINISVKPEDDRIWICVAERIDGSNAQRLTLHEDFDDKRIFFSRS